MAVSNSACDSHETHNKYPNLNAVPLSATPLNDQQRFRLNRVNEIEDSFVAEISERELTSKRLCKCIVSFEYFDKSLIFLSIATSSLSIASFATVVWRSVGIVIANFSLAFSISTGIVKERLKTTRNKTIKAQ